MAALKFTFAMGVAMRTCSIWQAKYAQVYRALLTIWRRCGARLSRWTGMPNVTIWIRLRPGWKVWYRYVLDCTRKIKNLLNSGTWSSVLMFHLNQSLIYEMYFQQLKRPTRHLVCYWASHGQFLLAMHCSCGHGARIRIRCNWSTPSSQWR